MTNQRGKIYRAQHITRHMVRQSPFVLFVFGDNMLRSGFGGQAKEMRGEPNTIGIPTKHEPTMRAGAFFTDRDFLRPDIAQAILAPLAAIHDRLAAGGDVVVPADGIGTGLAQLPQRAPKIAAILEMYLQD